MEIFKNIPKDNIIMVDPSDPASLKKAAEEIARRLNEKKKE